MERNDTPPAVVGAGVDLLCLALGAGFLFFIALGARDLWNPNEPIYGRAVVEMAERGDWRIPTVNGKVFAEKPILYFWSARIVSLLAGGVSEFTLRIPSAVAGVASVMLTYLLVLSYTGRRRALITAALFATLYQVFWSARTIQMDILVLATTLGVVLPLSRMLDFAMSPRRAWALAGIAAGLGFIAKGPVTLILPGMIVFLHAASQRKLSMLWSRWISVAALLAVGISAPWYLALWLGGQSAFLNEVLFRQNLTRFVEAWDHANPWWYYLTYLWTDYAPWSLLLPAALMIRCVSERERALHRMSGIWIASIVLFFSLADSKRAPYILPVAPAVAILAASVVDRWLMRAFVLRRAALAAAFGFMAVILALMAGGGYVTFSRSDIPASLRGVTLPLGIPIVISSVLLLIALTGSGRSRRWVPAGLWSMIVISYVSAAVWILPAANPLKSARDFAGAINERFDSHRGSVVSYRLWDWRAEYSFYAQKTIPNLTEPASLRAFWREHENACVFVEETHRLELQALIPDATLVREQQIGDGKASLFVKNPHGAQQLSGNDTRSRTPSKRKEQS